jgi:hypothetical protein
MAQAPRGLAYRQPWRNHRRDAKAPALIVLPSSVAKRRILGLPATGQEFTICLQIGDDRVYAPYADWDGTGMEQRGRNWSQTFGPRKARKRLEIAANRCHRLPAVAVWIAGKEGVDGSSPSGGFRFPPAQAALSFSERATAGGFAVHAASTAWTLAAWEPVKVSRRACGLSAQRGLHAPARGRAAPRTVTRGGGRSPANRSGGSRRGHARRGRVVPRDRLRPRGARR